MIAVVVSLVMLVGGLSVLGTVAVLSNQEASAAAEASPVEPSHGVVPEVIEGKVDEPPQGTAPVDGSAVATVEGSPGSGVPPLATPDVEGKDAERVPAEPADGSGTTDDEPPPQDESESTSGGEGDDEVDDGAVDGPPKTASTGTRSATGAKKRPMYETSECAKIREDAAAAYKDRQWGTLLKQAKKGWCWSSADEIKRLRWHVMALAELDQYLVCVNTGGKSSDPEIKAMVASCKKDMLK